MEKKRKTQCLISDVLTVIAEYVDKFTYPNCCLVNKEWYRIHKRFNKSFSFYYIHYSNGSGGAPREEYFVVNTLDEVSTALMKELFDGHGFYMFVVQEEMSLVKVLNDGKEIRLDLYDFVEVKYPSEFGDLPIHNMVEKDDLWKQEDVERFVEFVENLWDIVDFNTEGVMKKMIEVFVDVGSIAEEFGGKYVGSLDEHKSTVEIDGMDMGYGELISCI